MPLAAEEERHGVGRPRLVYFLTDEGLERFPTRYFRLTNRLIERMKETLPAPTVQQLFVGIAQSLADEMAGEVTHLSMEERLDLVKQLLAAEGFSVEWEAKGDSYHIYEISCPYYHIGQEHPEVCSLDQALISRVLAVPAEKVQCLLRGDAHCTYVIPKQLMMEKAQE
jgi:predicted ArsR family transcriptional regulator